MGVGVLRVDFDRLFIGCNGIVQPTFGLKQGAKRKVDPSIFRVELNGLVQQSNGVIYLTLVTQRAGQCAMGSRIFGPISMAFL